MLVYRYEYPDKGGVFFTLDGKNRKNNYIFDDNWISCCESIDALKLWFNKRKIDVSNCQIITYDIPKEAIKYTQTHLLFPKKYISI